MAINYTHTPKVDSCEHTDVYKPTIFMTDTLPPSHESPKELSGRRSVRFSSIETTLPANRSSLLTAPHAAEPHTVQRVPRTAQHRRVEGFSTMSLQRPKSTLSTSSEKRPIAESTDLRTMPDEGRYFPASSSSTSDSKVSRISCANQISQASRSEDTRIDSSFSSTSNKLQHRTSSTRPNPLLDGSIPQPEYSAKISAEQEIPLSQFYVVKVLQAEYVLLLLRSERLQKYRAFCALTYNLLLKTLRNKTASIRTEALKVAYSELAKSLTAANAALQEISKKTLATITPSTLKQLNTLNDAVEACTATRLRGLSLVPANECTERLSELLGATDEFLEHISPVEADVAIDSAKGITAELVSHLCRSTARLQALVYEAALLGHRKKP
ncbi:Hypothetical protein GLP15_769 [Giardia lamblia P15]|uniref:Uncharacterized protein n=1 Tax=Giardia intestinalis (strain P15) TaxID=658858 RepID=E1EXY4_GIAIA|nr:Hypothetical protein GLP15_769 [Giardia lamblia P15]